MPQGSPQFTPRQLLDAGRRAEAEGKLDHAIQLYRHLADHYAYTAEAAEARNGLGRIGAGAGQQLWAENGAVLPASMQPTPNVHGRTPGPHSSARNRVVAPKRLYRTGRVLATLVSCAGWLIVAAGMAMAPVLLATDLPLLRGVPYADSMGPAGTIAAAVGLCAVGLAVVFWGQMASALFDQANATRELVAIERARRDEQG
jgi:hypothetical protein